MKKSISLIILLGVYINAFCQPISLLKENPHYFLYKGNPTVLITSAEHYGAVVNSKFDFKAYFDWLGSYGLNYTRIYPGYLTELPDKWIKGNTLGLKSDEIIMPWKRSNEPGYAMGGNKFDLDQWDENFFARLRDFIETAAKKDIIIEICFYNAQYEDCWPLCPLYYKNNIQGIGNCHFNDAQTLDHPDLLAKEADYVARIVREVNKYDNVILEICDEPTINGTPLEKAGKWLDYMINVVVNTEKNLPEKHLIAQQIEGPLNGACDFSQDTRVSIITCQYAYWAYGAQLGGLNGLDLKYHLNKPVELNETYYYPVWYKGDSISDSRVEAWEFVVGGGSSFNHLNGRYTDENPSGNTPDNMKVCNSLKVLKEFMYSLSFTKMSPDKHFVTGGIPKDAFYRGMSWPGNQYALYIHHSQCTKDSAAFTVIPGNYKHDLLLNLPAGKYRTEWIDPATGEILKATVVNSKSGSQKLTTPLYSVDIALRIKKE
jgi:hypothetical protein